jgi:hypothetical protein
MIQIVEILGRSEQGVTRPFICRGDDDNTYFVKGVGAGRRSQVCEWIAGGLALELGLPIAPFEIVDVPEELVAASPDYRELGVGPAFGSLKQTIMELNYAMVDDVPAALRQAVLAFDWWIRNNDRMLTESGGNPNLFWEPEEERLVIIDHNQAFDPNFSVKDFQEYHVFRCARHGVFEDALRREEYRESFCSALEKWRDICGRIPGEWHYQDSEMTVEADFDLDAMFAMLNLCNTDALWDHS